jgi:hypothetical protein
MSMHTRIAAVAETVYMRYPRVVLAEGLRSVNRRNSNLLSANCECLENVA